MKESPTGQIALNRSEACHHKHTLWHSWHKAAGRTSVRLAAVDQLLHRQVAPAHAQLREPCLYGGERCKRPARAALPHTFTRLLVDAQCSSSLHLSLRLVLVVDGAPGGTRFSHPARAAAQPTCLGGRALSWRQAAQLIACRPRLGSNVEASKVHFQHTWRWWRTGPKKDRVEPSLARAATQLTRLGGCTCSYRQGWL